MNIKYLPLCCLILLIKILPVVGQQPVKSFRHLPRVTFYSVPGYIIYTDHRRINTLEYVQIRSKLQFGYPITSSFELGPEVNWLGARLRGEQWDGWWTFGGYARQYIQTKFPLYLELALQTSELYIDTFVPLHRPGVLYLSPAVGIQFPIAQRWAFELHYSRSFCINQKPPRTPYGLLFGLTRTFGRHEGKAADRKKT